MFNTYLLLLWSVFNHLIVTFEFPSFHLPSPLSWMRISGSTLFKDHLIIKFVGHCITSQLYNIELDSSYNKIVLELLEFLD